MWTYQQNKCLCFCPIWRVGRSGTGIMSMYYYEYFKYAKMRMEQIFFFLVILYLIISMLRLVVLIMVMTTAIIMLLLLLIMCCAHVSKRVWGNKPSRWGWHHLPSGHSLGQKGGQGPRLHYAGLTEASMWPEVGCSQKNTTSYFPISLVT